MSYDPADPLSSTNPLPVGLQAALPRNIATNASTQVKNGAGVFKGIAVNTVGTGSTAACYDGTSIAGTKLGTFATTAVGGVAIPAGGIAFATGLFVVTAGAGAADITVLHN